MFKQKETSGKVPRANIVSRQVFPQAPSPTMTSFLRSSCCWLDEDAPFGILLLLACLLFVGLDFMVEGERKDERTASVQRLVTPLHSFLIRKLISMLHELQFKLNFIS